MGTKSMIMTSRTAARFVRDRAGSIAILSAAMLPVAIGALALAVDMGSLYLERRQAQSVADLAALAGAADLDHAEAAVAATLQANGIDTNSVTVTRGNYTPNPQIAHGTRFRPGAGPTNAVEVTFSKPGRIYFANVFVDRQIDMEVRAVAANTAMATFSIGSRLLALRGGLINQLLGSMLGTSINLSVMDYEALVNTDVKLLSFMNALATELNLTGVTYNDVLNASMTAGDVLGAAATATAQDGNSSVAATLQTLASQAGTTSVTAPLSTIVNLGPLGTASVAQSVPGLDAGINAMELVSGTAALANSEHQVALDLGATIPGLLSLKVDLTIGEREQQSPWVTVGEPGSSVYTAQTRLRIVAEVGGSGLLSGVRIRLPIALDIAYARATLSDVSCSNGDPSTAQAKIAARPGIARAWIGELSASSLTNIHSEPIVSAARIVDTALIKVTGRADVAATNTSDTMLDFTQVDVDHKTVKRVGTSNIVETVVSSVLRNLSLNVQIGGLGLGLPGPIATLVANTLGAVAAPLDQLIYSLLTTLGVHLGEADVRVHGIRCGTAILAG
jgi:uncharacterized membrane protein